MARAKKKTEEAAQAPEEPVVSAYKGFGPGFICNPTGDKPFKYELGKTYRLTADAAFEEVK